MSDRLLERYELAKEITSLGVRCTCVKCEDLLSDDSRGLEIWYGKGHNGKSTLLRHLCAIYGEDKVYKVPHTSVVEDQMKGKDLIIVPEPNNSQQLDDLIEKYIQYGLKDKRYIIMTNYLPTSYANYDNYVLKEFVHTF